MSARDLIVKNFGWKVLAFLLATMIWFAVWSSIHLSTPGPSWTRAVESRSYSNLPITVMSAASDERGFRVDPPAVTVTIRASQELLRSITAADISAYVQIGANDTAPLFRRPIRASAPAGVAVTQIYPQEVEVKPLAPSQP